MSASPDKQPGELIRFPVQAGIPRSVLEEIVERLVEERLAVAVAAAVTSPRFVWFQAPAAAEHVGQKYSTFRRQAADGKWPRHLDEGVWYYRSDELDAARIARSERDGPEIPPASA